MTTPQETIVSNSARISESASRLEEAQVSRAATGGVEFLDESWAEEFDRRLAAWQTESPAAPRVESVPR